MMTGEDGDERAAAALRYGALDSLARREIETAADALLRRTDWGVWSLLTSSPTRGRMLRDARFAAFLAWERARG